MSGAPTDGVEAESPPARRNPWWIPPFLGRVPASLDDAHLRMLGTVALALLFEAYDQSMLTSALKHVAESFGVVESELGALIGWVHLGAVVAFLLIPFADRIGRRRLFLVSLIGISCATVASGLAQSVEQFIAFQMISRAFMVTCSATAYVIVTEEFPAGERGWGIGILGGLSGFGYGLGLLLFAGIDWLPYGWRALYVVGMVPLLLLPRFRRRVPETRRFVQHRAERARDADAAGLTAGWLRPLWALMRTYPGRSLGVGLIGSLSAAGHTVGFNFSAYHVLSVHGWPAAGYSLMAIAGGTIGIIGYPYAGRLADRRGRRIVGFGAFGLYPFLALAFYHGPGFLLPVIWVPLIFTLTGGNTIARALAAELFPTSHRGTASGWLQLSEALGRSSGAFLVAAGTAEGASIIPMISLVVFACLGAGLVVLALPETGRRELEEISQERESIG